MTYVVGFAGKPHTVLHNEVYVKRLIQTGCSRLADEAKSTQPQRTASNISTTFRHQYSTELF